MRAYLTGMACAVMAVGGFIVGEIAGAERGRVEAEEVCRQNRDAVAEEMREMGVCLWVDAMAEEYQCPLGQEPEQTAAESISQTPAPER